VANIGYRMKLNPFDPRKRVPRYLGYRFNLSASSLFLTFIATAAGGIITRWVEGSGRA